MERTAVMERIETTFRKVFGNPALTISEQSNSSNVENWDSMNHIRVIAALEKEFKCKFRLGELQQLKDVGGLCDLLIAKH